MCLQLNSRGRSSRRWATQDGCVEVSSRGVCDRCHRPDGGRESGMYAAAYWHVKGPLYLLNRAQEGCLPEERIALGLRLWSEAI